MAHLVALPGRVPRPLLAPQGLPAPGAEIVPSKDPVVVPVAGSKSRRAVKLPVAPAKRPVPHLDEALQRLDAIDPRQSRMVEQRYFGGLSLEEIAEALDVSLATVKRELRFAHAWLAAELGATGAANGSGA